MLIVEEAQVVDGVAREPRQVERDEVKVEPDDRLPLEVDVALGVEGDGPGNEVNPPHDRTKSLNWRKKKEEEEEEVEEEQRKEYGEKED